MESNIVNYVNPLDKDYFHIFRPTQRVSWAGLALSYHLLGIHKIYNSSFYLKFFKIFFTLFEYVRVNVYGENDHMRATLVLIL